MASRAWKEHEKRTAELLGGSRVIRADWGQSDVDVEHPVFAVECKHRASLALARWWEQARKNAKGKIPVVVAHEAGKKRRYVIIDIDNFNYLININEKSMEQNVEKDIIGPEVILDAVEVQKVAVVPTEKIPQLMQALNDYYLQHVVFNAKEEE